MATFDIIELLSWCSNNNCKLTLEFNPETMDGYLGEPDLTITVSKWSNAEHNWCHKKQIVPLYLLCRLEVDEFKEYIEYMRYEVRDAVIEKDREWQKEMAYKVKTHLEPDSPLHNKYSKEKDDEG